MFVLLMLSPLLILSFSIHPAAANPGIIVKTWGGSDQEFGHGVAVASSGDIYVTGSTRSFGFGAPSNISLVLLKYNSMGDLQWRRVWGGNGSSTGVGNGETGSAVAVDAAGDVYVTGRTESFAADGLSDGILLKFASNGSLLWQETWGGSKWDEGDGVAVDPAGNVYVTGETSSFSASYDVAVLKFASNGSLLMEKTWGGSDPDHGQGIAVDIAGNVYITGSTSLPSPVYSVGFLLKFDPSGSLVVQDTWGGPATSYHQGDYGRGVGVDAAGNIYVVGGTSRSGAGGYDASIWKFDPFGSPLWERTWGESTDDVGEAIDVNATGNIYVTGDTPHLLLSPMDVFILNLDTSGNLLMEETFTSNGGVDYSGGIARDASGNPVAAGSVEAGSPYTLGSGNSTLGAPAFAPSIIDLVPGSPGFVLGIPPAGTISAPAGSETYAGAWDIFLLLPGERATVTFHVTPSTGGKIAFNHTDYNTVQTYMEGQSGGYPLGNAVATAVPFSDLKFTSWSVSGGVTVSNVSSNPTTVTVTGSGSLTAHFTAISTPITPPGLLISSLIALTIPVWIWRRRKRGLSLSQSLARSHRQGLEFEPESGLCP